MLNEDVIEYDSNRCIVQVTTSQVKFMASSTSLTNNLKSRFMHICTKSM